MKKHPVSRRSFLTLGAATAAGVLTARGGLSVFAAPPTASGRVPLGRGGATISRIGIGTGSNGGQVQRDLGQEAFTRLVRHAYDRGVTYIDTADNYRTHEMVRRAVQGLPREELFILTKMPWHSDSFRETPLKELDRYRTELNTDYLDCLLIHCTTTSTWPEDLAKMIDAFGEAQQRGWIRLKGVSCHGLPALRRATHEDWIDVHLARVNPQGHHCDGATGEWAEAGDIGAAMKEISAMHARGRGVIGMKIVGNGDFTSAEDREKAVRYALSCGVVDSMVIGFKNTSEIDEAVERVDRNLRSLAA
jgi:hypothetical protein